jgi:hypothetical protein
VKAFRANGKDLDVEALPEILAEYILEGFTSEQALSAACARGFAPVSVSACLEDLWANPLLRIAARKTVRLKKVQGILRLLYLLRRHAHHSEVIAEETTIGADEFVSKYYSNNWPVVIRRAAASWPLLATLSWDELSAHYGNTGIEYCAEPPPRTPSSRRERSTLAELIRRVRSTLVSNEFYLVANDKALCRPPLTKILCAIGDLPFIEEFDSFRPGANLWVGPRGAVTPLHFDIANNILVQALGVKEITLAPALAYPFLYSEGAGFYSDVDPTIEDGSTGAHSVWMRTTLFPGDALFIPAAWSHWVYSKTAAVSISFNFTLENGHDQFTEVLSSGSGV